MAAVAAASTLRCGQGAESAAVSDPYSLSSAAMATKSVDEYVKKIQRGGGSVEGPPKGSSA
jgi:hypothetical protein